MHLAQSWQDVGALSEVERGNDPLLFHPLVDAELVRGMSLPLKTRKDSSNFSLSSRCHWNVRLAGQTTNTPLDETPAA